MTCCPLSNGLLFGSMSVWGRANSVEGGARWPTCRFRHPKCSKCNLVASRAANPACPPWRRQPGVSAHRFHRSAAAFAILQPHLCSCIPGLQPYTSAAPLHLQDLFCISGRLPRMSARVFERAHSGAHMTT